MSVSIDALMIISMKVPAGLGKPPVPRIAGPVAVPARPRVI